MYSFLSELQTVLATAADLVETPLLVNSLLNKQAFCSISIAILILESTCLPCSKTKMAVDKKIQFDWNANTQKEKGFHDPVRGKLKASLS